MAADNSLRWKKVPPGHLKRLIESERSYSREVNMHPVVYPDPQDRQAVRAAIEQPARFGFSGHNLLDSTVFQLLGERLQLRSSKGGKAKRGKKKTGTTLLDPEVVFKAVDSRLEASGATDASATGHLIWAEQNFEFLSASKAKWFIKTYKRLLPLAHVWLCAEVSQEGIAEIASQTGYTAYCSAENTRGQAVAIMLHPRLRVVGVPLALDDVAMVQGIPDLRPVLKIDLEDTATCNRFWAAAVHLKSMRGGLATTAAVRYQQCEIIARDLSGTGVIGGDWNTFLGNSHDTDPLINAHFKLADPGDTRSTQSMGGRLDGFFLLNMPRELSHLEVWQWFADKTIGRALTDHGTLRAAESV